MKLSFIHDHPFYVDNGLVYSGGGLPSRVWHNYLSNFESMVVLGRESCNEKDKKVVSSLPNVEFKLSKGYSTVLSVFKNWSLISTEINEVISQADVVLVRLPSVLGVLAGLHALRRGKSLWVEQVGNAKEAMNTHGSLSGKIVAPFLETLNKYIVRKAKYVTYVTAHQLQKSYPASDASATVNLSNVLINKVLDYTELDESRFFSKQLQIGLIGGFDAKYKGQDTLLESISLLDKEIKDNIKLSFVGKGDYSWVIAKSKSLNMTDNITFIGPLESGEQINNFLINLSLYVQPSLTEGMPRSTIEAMAMGCPVIGSNVGGIPELVSNKYIHMRGDVKQLSGHIECLYLNREALREEADLSLQKAIHYTQDTLRIRRNKFYLTMNEIEKK